jgi:diaminohydroxyphosphoribosylaminopyrimidine deaminase/5-amino-6-(5-phosphoribosylamino)uracil reductase
MKHALEFAQAQLGQTWPNPSVGAVIVQNNIIIGEGATAKNGRPHAETIALAQAGDAAKGATMYVTLEPCSHVGQTPPCAQAIIDAGISHCIIATRDPNPKVDGGGIKMLKDAGIKVTTGVCKKEANEQHRGFFSVIERGRPYIALKIATSADEKIAATANTRTTITGTAAREHGQRLRAEFDAILTGIGTVLIDNPQMNVRIKGLEHKSPIRIVLDRQHRLPATSKILPAWTYDLPLEDVIKDLTERGITRLLIEAGQALNTAFLDHDWVDRVYWYQSPDTLEGGLDAVKNSSLSQRLSGWQPVGDMLTLASDTLTILEKPCSRASSTI